MFYLANKMFVSHTIITVCGVAFAYLQDAWILLGVFVVLWLLASVLYMEWRNS